MPQFTIQIILTVVYAALGALLARTVPDTIGRMVVSSTSDRSPTSLSGRRGDTVTQSS